jgi:hypothetical protein
MEIKKLFQKDINRYIETVIKADDREHISDEVAEYVITNEIAKKVGELFEAYNDYAGANGVWISGFFGSGKSHLLKILSYVLENKQFDGYASGELFAAKIEDDAKLKGDVEKATRIPSESILFNIDQQAQITSKTDENAILSVFYKVFYDHLGYYGFQPHVAEFEMWLDKQGKLDAFRKKFKSAFGKPWTDARINYFDPIVHQTIADVLAELNKSEASKYARILDELEDRHKQSIEDLCNRIAEHIATKPKGFRLNFFVDEVGQYISDNTKLMLNLQTIAETLATRTKGHSWILVTSQEDMEKVVGDLNRQQLNDFSRIQARFKIKVPLTSANVGEVIEKRLLKKNDKGVVTLAKVFKQDEAHLASLLSFAEAGVQFRGYRGDEDFVNKYPFIPYQFDLFQQCRRSLSTHNAFQGRHASVGERSMLGVFQQVAKAMESRNTDAVVSFDLMYEGVRHELRGEIQSAVIMAEKNLDNQLAIKVLKALFLVKYYPNFKTTKRNISVLMIDDMRVDIKKHDRAVEEALNILENQNYVQRNGDLYEFLTNDEQDVERAIKETDIDEQAITSLLKEVFFDEILKDTKIRYQDNKQEYDFTSKIDGALIGRERELEVEVVTQNHRDYENTDHLKAQTMGSSGMKLVLPPDPVFMKDVRMYLRTDKYVKQNQSTTNREEVKRIFREKAQQNVERRRNLVLLGNKALAGAHVYMNGAVHEMGQTTDGKTRVFVAFQDLVKTAYPSLRMLGPQPFTEDTVKQVMRSKQDDLFGTDDQTISEAESEVMNLVHRRAKQSDRTSLNDLRTHFSKKPYGWYPNAIWTVAAKLFKRGKLEFRQDSNLLEQEPAMNAMLTNTQHGNTLLEAQVEFDATAVNALKTAYNDAFDESCPARDAKDVANAFRAKLQGLHTEVDQLLKRKRDYPFLENLEGFARNLERWSQKDYVFFLTKLKDFEDELLDGKEKQLDPIKQFMRGSQVEIYDGIRTLLQGDTSNLEYVDGDEPGILRQVMADPAPYRGNTMKEAKAAKESLTKKVLGQIDLERQMAITSILNAIDDLQHKPEFKKLQKKDQADLLRPLQEEVAKLADQRFIARIRDIRNIALDRLFTQQLDEMIRLATPPPPKGAEVSEPQVKYIKGTQVQVKFEQKELRTEEDVDAYVEALRKAMKDQIKDNRRISLT